MIRLPHLAASSVLRSRFQGCRPVLARPLFTAVLTAFVAACAPGDAGSDAPSERPDDRTGLPPVVEMPPELDRVLRDFEAGWEARDAQALADLFTEDGYVLYGGELPAVGRAEILEMYQGRGGPLSLVPYDYAVSDSVGFIIGGYAGSPEAREGGKFVLTLKRGDDGRWLIHSDMDNGNGGN